MKYIYSTLSNNNIYVAFEKSSNGTHKKTTQVLVNGGANIADRKTLITPKGVLTIVDDKDYEAIKDTYLFKLHLEKGFITVESKKTDADEVAKNLTSEDNSSPETEAKIAKKSKAKVKE